MCGISLCTRSALDTWSRGRSTAALDDTVMPRGKVTTANAALLLLALPFLLRLWVEAVAWRLERGPQMLGFSLAHGGAGALTVPLLISLLANFVYWLFVAVVGVLWLFPTVRARLAGTALVLLGGTGTFGFQALATYMQNDLPTGVLYTGAVALSVLFVFLLAVTVVSFRRKVPARVV